MIVVLRYVLPGFLLLICLVACSSLPARRPLSGPESLLVSDSFMEMSGRQRQCKSSVDADITVTLDSKFYSGTTSGYFQAMAPAFLKIVGINPFGQPWGVFVSDGDHFEYALLNESRSYNGKVDSESFRRFTPSGFDPGLSFYSLTAKQAPGKFRILSTSGEPDGNGAWLELEHINDNRHSLVLFDPDTQLIHQYLQLDQEGEVAMKIVYGDYYHGPCNLPGHITISGSGRAGKLQLRLKEWRTDTPFSSADFELELPPGFTKETVN